MTLPIFDPSPMVPGFSCSNHSDIADGLPTLSGWESALPTAATVRSPLVRPAAATSSEAIRSVFAIALHMHQPIVPAGANGELISYLQYMLEHPFEGKNFNAGAFTYCYTRIADFLIDGIRNGSNPRIMLDYSGTLLWGLRDMGRGEILENLKRITCNPDYYPHVEWLGTFWSHALVPTVPITDFKLQVQAWQHHFAALFGWEALSRVQGFSVPDLLLPTHPDVLYEFVSVLVDAGYRWMWVDESSIETLDGDPIQTPYLPHQFRVRNSQGAIATIPVFVRPANQRPEAVARLSAYDQAKDLAMAIDAGNANFKINGVAVPPLIAHLADGENGEAMMNEFPSAFRNTWYDLPSQEGRVVSMALSEYLAHLDALGCCATDFPSCQAKGHAQLWQTVAELAPLEPERAIAQLAREAGPLSITGHTGTNVYPAPTANSPAQLITHLSTRFHKTIAKADATEEPLTQQYRYRNALLHHLLVQTSCFIRWQEQTWYAYVRELYRRAEAILRHDF